MNSSTKRVEINEEVLNLGEEDNNPDESNEEKEEDFEEDCSPKRKTSAKLYRRNAMGEYIPKEGEKPLTLQAISGPGPALYTPVTNLTKPLPASYSIVGRPKETTVDHIPGSNEYDIRANMVWNKKTRTLKDKLETSPYNRNPREHVTCSLGSATYKVDYYKTGKHAEKHTISSRHNDGINIGPPNTSIEPVDTKSFFSPGPNYAPHDERGLKKTFGLPFKGFLPKCSPGPAEYNVTTTHLGPQYSLGHRIQDLSAFNVPGPGAYEMKSTVGDGVATSIRGRQPIKKTYTGPAPNIYTLPNALKDAPKYSMTYRPFEVEEECLPGPAYYNQDCCSVWKSPAKYSCRRLCRPSFPSILNYQEYGLMKNEDVGPVTYDAHKGFEKNSSPAYSIGTTMPKLPNNYPGPAHYNIPIPCRPDSFKAPEFLMGKAVEIGKGTAGPGPAAYQPYDKEITQGYSMSGRPKPRKVKPTPAPNAYKIQKGQTSKGTTNGSSATFKSRPSPYVYSGFPNLSRITT